MGNYGYGKRNKRGERFVQFCLQNNLKIANTLFRKPRKLRWTWLSPDGYTRNEIDFIATNKPNIIENCSVINSVHHPSDHRMVRITINIERRYLPRKNFSTTARKQIDYEIYTAEINKFIEPDTITSVQNYYDIIEKTILQSAERLVRSALCKIVFSINFDQVCTIKL
ncbi:unnamed protein product [Arctia plantaginis]|uniref:Endonuclease/exonuclease/phosphatase domain-containing protein n=1 Tax=Arctia plantaginis TaxID=874455 RepID=A0A8S1AMT7_ARCPL|nr:unnamed protein product [Arctia plantaginis]